MQRSRAVSRKLRALSSAFTSRIGFLSEILVLFRFLQEIPLFGGLTPRTGIKKTLRRIFYSTAFFIEDAVEIFGDYLYLFGYR
jgi:hypothetical protein